MATLAGALGKLYGQALKLAGRGGEGEGKGAVGELWHAARRVAAEGRRAQSKLWAGSLRQMRGCCFKEATVWVEVGGAEKRPSSRFGQRPQGPELASSSKQARYWYTRMRHPVNVTSGTWPPP